MVDYPSKHEMRKDLKDSVWEQYDQGEIDKRERDDKLDNISEMGIGLLRLEWKAMKEGK